MKTFKNLDEALAYLESSVSVNLEVIGENIKEILRKNVEKLWYGVYTPSHYTRTHEYINSITVTKANKVGEGYEVMIYFDTDKINPHGPAKEGEWPRHQSIIGGDDVSKMIPHWIEYGQNSPLYSYAGVEPAGRTADWVREEKYLKKRMIELLTANGFKCI